MGAQTGLEGVTTSRLIAGATTLRILGAVILAALAVFAALLASDVRAWPFALDRGDAVYAVSPGAASWTPATRLGGVAASLLGVGRDVTSRRALVLYRQVAGQQVLRRQPRQLVPAQAAQARHCGHRPPGLLLTTPWYDRTGHLSRQMSAPRSGPT